MRYILRRLPFAEWRHYPFPRLDRSCQWGWFEPKRINISLTRGDQGTQQPTKAIHEGNPRRTRYR